MSRKLSAFIYRLLPPKLYDKYLRGDERSKLAFNNILISLVTKVANIICSLLLVPITINYVNADRYGIWMTLSVVIGWITFFDFGLGHGFRNKFAEAKANGDIELARQYVSTTYFAITSIICLILCVTLVLNKYINWSDFLHISSLYSEELRKVFAVVITFTCLNMVVHIFTILLTADMRPGIASIIGGIGQYVVLLVIFILTRTTEGSLINLAFCYSGIPVIVTLLFSVFFFSFTRYKQYAPSIRCIRPALISNIINLGFQFMIIQLCMIAIFQVINLVITRELGPAAVTQYTVANKYFSLVYMVLLIILTPMWSSFTDAYTKRDYTWMIRTLHRLERLCLIVIPVLLVMLAVANFSYRIWVGKDVTIPSMLSFTMMIMILVENFASTYMYCINGIGCIRLQLIVYVFCAVFSWPMLVFFANHLGIAGVTLVPIIVYLLQAIVGRVQLSKILNGTAKGIWKK